MFLKLLVLFYYFHISLSFLSKGWHYLNIHCRDNNNAPMDWWHVIKPPGNTAPYEDSGRHFSFVVGSDETLNPRWRHADRLITSENLITYTLNPIYKPTYTDHVAYVVFEERKPSVKGPGSTTRAVLMADEIAGLIITYTVPNFIDMHASQFTFPEEEIAYGHLISCLSLEHSPLNGIAKLLHATHPVVKGIHIPNVLRTALPFWEQLMLETESALSAPPDEREPSAMDFQSESNLVHAMMLARKPGYAASLYDNFAKNMSIVLDVYSPFIHPHKNKLLKLRTNFCNEDFGVREIEKIGIKTHDYVEYIDPMTDKVRFAVSTAAHWQRQGSKTKKYWVCVGGLAKNDITRQGGFLLCTENNHIWFNFDNLKTKEPQCPVVKKT